jgi:drug/metabolite transporter (DMT)-like permease
MQKDGKAKYYLALGGAVFFWSSAFVVSKIALTGMGPITLSTFRILICFFALLPLAHRRGFRFRALFKKNSFIYGIVGYGGNLVLLTIGLNACSASISAIAHGLFPVFMVFFGYMMLSEKVTRPKAAGVVFAVAGVVVASVGDLSMHSGSKLWGILLVAFSVFIWACYSVFAKKTAAYMDALVLTELGFGTAAICSIPLAAGELIVTGIPAPTMPTLFCIVYLSVMSGIVATVLWNVAVSKVPAVVSGIFFNLMPVIGLGFALVAGEKASPAQLGGCALVIIGVLLVSLSGRERKNK